MLVKGSEPFSNSYFLILNMLTKMKVKSCYVFTGTNITQHGELSRTVRTFMLNYNIKIEIITLPTEFSLL